MSKHDMLGPITRALVGVPSERLGVVMDVVNKVGSEKGDLWKARLTEVLREGLPKKVIKQNQILKQLTSGIVIYSCDGTQTLINASDVFKGHIDSKFKNCGTNKLGDATGGIAMAVHEMIEDATCAQMFGSFEIGLDKLCMTQHQIKEFCKKHEDWLRTDDYGTFFLFKTGGQFLVAGVFKGPDGWGVSVFRFKGDDVWFAKGAHRVVVPQLMV
jgi:hypothetical protein